MMNQCPNWLSFWSSSRLDRQEYFRVYESIANEAISVTQSPLSLCVCGFHNYVWTPILSFCRKEKFAYGHVYLRPQETFHEPSRKFFPNEVFRVPMYEIIPINVIIGTCCVLDLTTYCKGRPKGAKEDDVYICEFRLDKTAHVFYKISRSKYPTNTKLYCFDAFDKKLQPKRTFSVSISYWFYSRNLL
jgi:hypothetical protein